MKHARFSHLSDADLKDIEDDLHWHMATIIMVWGACESWLSGIVVDLLRTNEYRAASIMASISSTRAKVQLVQNLMDVCVKDKRTKGHFNKLLADFKTLTQLRNMLCHSTYHQSAKLCVCEYIAYVNPDKFRPGYKSYIDFRVIDRGFINELKQAAKLGSRLSERFGRFRKNLAGKVHEPPAKLTQRQAASRIAKLLRLRRGKRPKPKRRGQSSPESKQTARP